MVGQQLILESFESDVAVLCRISMVAQLVQEALSDLDVDGTISPG